jgi:hypothetical protein
MSVVFVDSSVVLDFSTDNEWFCAVSRTSTELSTAVEGAPLITRDPALRPGSTALRCSSTGRPTEMCAEDLVMVGHGVQPLTAATTMPSMSRSCTKA